MHDSLTNGEEPNLVIDWPEESRFVKQHELPELA